MHSIKSYPCHVALWLPIQRESGRSSSTASRLRSILILSYTIYKGLCPGHSRLRAQSPGHVITQDQWEASIQVTWSLSSNERPVFRSRDHSRPMRGKYPGHLITIVQWEASIQITWSASTNERPVSRLRYHSTNQRPESILKILDYQEGDKI